jgi:phosphoheptose isomerase
MQLGVEYLDRDAPSPTQSHYEDLVTAHLNESARVKRQIADLCIDSILAAASLMAEAFRSGGKVLLCGNGGSAADCQHIAAELVNFLTKEFPRPGLPAIALTTDTSLISAIANDSGFERVFSRQVQALGQSGDVLIGISTSGNSPNVIRAVEAAQSLEMRTIALTGASGRLVDLAEIAIAVPSTQTQYIQEAHLAIEHILCELVEEHLFHRNR